MQVASRKIIESTTTPGVKLTIRRLNKIQRANRDYPVMAERLRVTAALSEFKRLEPKTDDSSDPPEVQAKRRALDYEASLLYQEHLIPASIKAGLVSIEGLEIDGVAITTAKQLLECGTPETDALLDEIYEACESASGLTEQERKNLPSPTISVDPVGDKTSDSTALPVAV